MKSVKEIFVYGTLMKGYRNYNKYFQGKVLEIREGYVLGTLYNLPEYSCPAVVQGVDKVYGELIRFENVDDTLQKIDDMEKSFENDTLSYDREEVKVFLLNGENVISSSYICKTLDQVKHELIQGKWQLKDNSK